VWISRTAVQHNFTSLRFICEVKVNSTKTEEDTCRWCLAVARCSYYYLSPHFFQKQTKAIQLYYFTFKVK
jgi:hypothetical protein